MAHRTDDASKGFLLSIPFHRYDAMHAPLRERMIAVAAQVIDGGCYLSGDRTAGFERAFAQYCGTRFAVGTGNGLDAIVLAMKALGIGPGNEVIIPANTYVATVLAVTHAGAIPVLVEPRESTFNIDPDACAVAITDRTRAIIPVHLFGQPCEMTALTALAKTHGLYLIEDNAQAHGARYEGRRTGGWGDLNATSFHPGKNLGAFGDGGAVTTDDEELAIRVRMWGNYGSPEKYLNRVLGHNSRLDELQAALLRVKLDRLDAWNEERRSLAATYAHGLAGVGDIQLPVEAPGAEHVYHRYVIRTRKRDALRDHLSRSGIGTLIHYPVPPHLQEAYRSHRPWRKGMFPITERMAETSLSLPLYPGLKSEEQQHVIGSVRGFFD